MYVSRESYFRLDMAISQSTCLPVCVLIHAAHLDRSLVRSALSPSLSPLFLSPIPVCHIWLLPPGTWYCSQGLAGWLCGCGKVWRGVELRVRVELKRCVFNGGCLSVCLAERMTE